MENEKNVMMVRKICAITKKKKKKNSF